MKAKHVGERLRAIRLSKGLRPIDMAELLDIERTYWTRWEKGHRPIPVADAARLTELFDVDLDYILTGSLRSVPPEMQVELRSAASRKLPED